MANSTPSSPRFFPEIGAPESVILAYRDRQINPWSAYRNQQMARIAMWMWYYLGRHWATIDFEAAFDGARGAILRSAISDGDMPRPVTNEVDPAVEAAVIAMVKREWNAKVTPSNSDPSIKAAAQVAQDQLQHRLTELGWPEKRRQHALHYVTTGTGLIYTGWDRSYLDLKAVGAPSAVWCESCQNKLYSDLLPLDVLKAGIGGRPVSFADSAKPLTVEDDGYDPESNLHRLSACPFCDDNRQLAPYTPDLNEAAGADDIFGRPLGVLEPRGESTMEIDLPFEVYPQDGGFRQMPSTIRRYGRRKIRSLEWWEEHAPHVVDEIEPDSIQELIYTDPILNEWSMMGRWDGILDAGILDNHANADELIEQPSLRHPMGRYVLCSKNKVVEDTTLLEKAEPDGDGECYYVPRAQISAARFKIRPNEFFGSGLPCHMISPNNRLNSMDSQLVEWRERLGSPNLYMPADMWIDNPVHQYGGDADGQGGGRVFFFQPSVSNPDFTKPEVFGGLLMPDSVYNERDRIQADIKRQNGPQDATMGAAPKNVGATSGLQFLVDQDEVAQSVREDELIRSGEKAFSHILRMQWLLRADEDEYRVMGPDKCWSYEQYTGQALRGQVECTVERGPAVSRGIVTREAAREALADGLIDVSSPLTKRKLLVEYGLDPDLAPETTHQIDHAERLWVDFRDHGIVRNQDSIDNPLLHHLVLGKFLRTEEGERMADEANWDQVLKFIAGWQDELQRMETIDAMTIQFYGGRLIGEEEKKNAYGQALLSYDQQKQLFVQQQQIYNEQSQLSQVTKTPLGPAPVAPNPPPPPIFLPAALQDRVLMVWGRMLAASDFQIPQPELGSIIDQRPPDAYIRFRALVEAYRLSAAAQAGTISAVPSPGSPAPAAAPALPSAGGGGDTVAPPPTASPAPTPEGGSN